jgi:hypothetical protein
MLDGGETIGVLSTASSSPRPKVDKEANGVIAAARAALLIKFLLDEFDIVFVLLFLKIEF